MKYFYTYLRSIVAFVALCLPMLVSAQELDFAPDEIVGRYKVEFGTATLGDGSDASAIKLTYTAKVSFSRSGDLSIDGIIGTPSKTEYVDDERVTTTALYTGVWNSTANTVTVSFPYPAADYSIYDANSEALFSLAQDNAFTLNVSQNTDGLYVMSTDENVVFTYSGDEETTCTFAGVTFTQLPSYTIAQTDLVGTWKMTYKTYNDDGDIADAEGTFTIGAEEEGSLYFTGFQGFTYHFPITYSTDGISIARTIYTPEDDTTGAGIQALFGDLYGMDETANVEFVFDADNSLTLESYMAGAAGSTQFYVLQGATAVKEQTEEPKEDPKELGDAITSLDQLDMTKTYAIYNDHFTAYAAYEPDYSTTNVWCDGPMIGDSSHALNCESPAYDLTSANMAWMVLQKDGKYYLYNVGGKKYFDTSDANTSYRCKFSDAAFALDIESLGDGKFAFNSDGDTKHYACIDPRNSNGPVAFWTSSDAGSAWQFKENPNVDADLEVAKEFGYTEPDPDPEPETDAAPADMAGRYSIEVGDYTWTNENEYSSVDVTAYAKTFTGTIEIDANGKALMKGLVGTPSVTTFDPETWVQQTVDSAYVGTYNAANSTITFAYPADDADNNMYYSMYMPNSYDTWQVSEDFTLSVSKNDEGLYVLSTTDAIHFLLGGSDQVDAAGATFTQLKSYSMNADELTGYWTLKCTSVDDMTGDETETTLKVKIVEEDGQLYMLAGNGATVKFPIELTSYGFRLKSQNSYDENGTYMIMVSSSAMAISDVEFAFTEDGAFELISDAAYLANDKIEYLYLTAATAARPVTTINPAAGHYETMPSEFVICTNAANVSATKGVILYYESDVKGKGSMMTNELTIASDSIVFTLASDVVTGATSLKLSTIAFDEDGNSINFNAEYTADKPAATLGDAVTSLDQLSTEKTYVIYNDHFTAYAIYAADKSETNIWAANMIGDSGHTLQASCPEFDATDVSSSWMAVKKGDALYLYNLGAKKYLNTTGANNGSGACTFSDEPVALKVVELGDGKFAFSASGLDYDYFCGAPQLAETPLSVWSSDDAGSAWQFIENPNVEAKFPYGDAVASLSDLSEDKAYYVYNDHFTAYAVYAADKSETNIWAANMIGDSGHTLAAEIPALDALADASSWMAIQHEGKLYLYNLGAKKYLNTTGANNGSGACTFSEEPVALTVVELGDGKFAFSASGLDYDYFCGAPQLAENPLSVWTSSDAGSAWQFIESPFVEVDSSVKNAVTGIQQVEAAHSAAEGIYTISGVKLNVTDTRKLQKGLYIVNGKKVLVK